MRITRRLAVLACSVAILALAIALVGCSSAGSTSGTGSSGTTGGTSTGANTIVEQNFAFNPSSLTVKVGDTVTFTNKDSAAHNVSIDGQELGIQNQGESKTWTASKAGSFPFKCVIHPSMTGQVTVQ